MLSANNSDSRTSMNDLLCRVSRYRRYMYMSRAWAGGRNYENVHIYQAINMKAGDYYIGPVINHDVGRTLASKIRSYCV